MSKDIGGPAFPLHAHDWHKEVSDRGYVNHDFTMGVTLRDYFAAKAMQVILGNYDIATSFEDGEVNDPEGMPTLIAIDAYVMADAMLKARER